MPFVDYCKQLILQTNMFVKKFRKNSKCPIHLPTCGIYVPIYKISDEKGLDHYAIKNFVFDEDSKCATIFDDMESTKYKKPLLQSRRPGGPGGGKGAPPKSGAVNFLQANKVLLSVFAVLLILAIVVIKKKPTAVDENADANINATDESQEGNTPIQPKNTEQVPSRAILPGQRESTQEELSNYKEEEATPEFIAERKIQLLEQADIELSGGEKVLAKTTDQKAAAIIQERIEALKRFKQVISQINPKDPATWKLLEEAENKERGKSQI